MKLLEILLDTTVQIERIFKRKRKEKIEKLILEHNCGSSTYVLGEYKNNMIKDFVTLYNIMQMEDTLAGVRDNINDNVFHRSFQRVYYVFNDLCKQYNDDFDLIKEELKTYAKRLERRFYYGIDSKLLNDTDCHRAKAQVVFKGKKASIQGIQCTKNDNFCKVCEFWQSNRNNIVGIEEKEELQEKMKQALNKILKNNELAKGNICKSLGDCIISLEALETEGKMVCTTNVNDFKTICDYIGVEMRKIE